MQFTVAKTTQSRPKSELNTAFHHNTYTATALLKIFDWIIVTMCELTTFVILWYTWYSHTSVFNPECSSCGVFTSYQKKPKNGMLLPQLLTHVGTPTSKTNCVHDFKINEPWHTFSFFSLTKICDVIWWYYILLNLPTWHVFTICIRL